IPLNPVGSASANQPTPSTQEAQVVLEKSSDDDGRPIAQVLRKPSSSGQPRLTEPTVSSHSKKSKKHKRSAPTGFEVDASTEPTQPVADYTPASPVSSPAHPFQSVDTAGEFIEFPIQISDSDSDSVTSPATHPNSSSTSSDSSPSSTSFPLQDPQGQ
ncbi:uncharacterized protein LOC127115040, partial [Lathyrus oleraceus]|uniref:uncharacterized protein LOC127115040 n=1 Tax=Pisum sativum TaxID=3888 RepID=UPI0021D1E23E